MTLRESLILLIQLCERVTKSLRKEKKKEKKNVKYEREVGEQNVGDVSDCK